jgi:hypothetical protein
LFNQPGVVPTPNTIFMTVMLLADVAACEWRDA